MAQSFDKGSVQGGAVLHHAYMTDRAHGQGGVSGRLLYVERQYTVG